MATLKKSKNWFKTKLSLNADQKYRRMLIKLRFVIMIFFCLSLSGRFTQVLLYEPNLENFVCFDFLHPSEHFFSHNRMGLPGLNQY